MIALAILLGVFFLGVFVLILYWPWESAPLPPAPEATTKLQQEANHESGPSDVDDDDNRSSSSSVAAPDTADASNAYLEAWISEEPVSLDSRLLKKDMRIESFYDEVPPPLQKQNSFFERASGSWVFRDSGFQSKLAHDLPSGTVNTRFLASGRSQVEHLQKERENVEHQAKTNIQQYATQFRNHQTMVDLNKPREGIYDDDSF